MYTLDVIWPALGAFLVTCLLVGFWVRDLRIKFNTINQCIGKAIQRVDCSIIYDTVRPYFQDFPQDAMPPKAMSVKSVRSYRDGEYHTEFYGEFMRLYRLDENKEITEDIYLMFHWLPRIMTTQFSTAELFEHIGVAWVNDCSFRRLCSEVVSNGA